MRTILSYLFFIILGLGSGFLISGGVFTFIGMIGIVPRMAIRTNTDNHVMFYEEVIMFGGLFGALSTFIEYKFNFNMLFFIPYWFFQGIFVGSLAVSLAEVMDVIPIAARRIRLRKGLMLFVFVIAVGKVVGSLMYFLIPGFF